MNGFQRQLGQSIKGSSCKHEDPSSVHGSHIKNPPRCCVHAARAAETGDRQMPKVHSVTSLLYLVNSRPVRDTVLKKKKESSQKAISLVYTFTCVCVLICEHTHKELCMSLVKPCMDSGLACFISFNQHREPTRRIPSESHFRMEELKTQSQKCKHLQSH